jgi:hypothetical protein
MGESIQCKELAVQKTKCQWDVNAVALKYKLAIFVVTDLGECTYTYNENNQVGR